MCNKWCDKTLLKILKGGFKTSYVPTNKEKIIK